jgi:hypothetical protein
VHRHPVRAESRPRMAVCLVIAGVLVDRLWCFGPLSATHEDGGGRQLGAAAER